MDVWGSPAVETQTVSSYDCLHMGMGQNEVPQ